MKGKTLGILALAGFAVIAVLLLTGVFELPVPTAAIPADGDEDLEPGVCTATNIQLSVKGKHSVNTGTDVEDTNGYVYKNGNFIGEQRLSSDSSFDIQPGTVDNPVTAEVVLFDSDSSMTYYGQKMTGISIGCVDKTLNPLIDEIGTVTVVLYNDDGNGNSISMPMPLSAADVEDVIIRLQEGTADKVFGGGITGILVCADYNQVEIDSLSLESSSKVATPSGHAVADIDLATTQCFELDNVQLVDKEKIDLILTIDVDDTYNPVSFADTTASTGILFTVYDPCLFQDDAGNWVTTVRDPDDLSSICGTDGNALLVT